MLYIYMLSKGNELEWFVHSVTTLQASCRNGSTTPPTVAKWQDIKMMGNFIGCRTVTI